MMMNVEGATGHMRASLAFVVAAVMMLAGTTSIAQNRNAPFADAELQRKADSLQRCLESELVPLQIDSSLSTDGRFAETVRVTRWNADAGRACAGLAGSRCENPNGLQRVIDLEFITSEASVAWPANDRARLEDLVPATLLKLPGAVKVKDRSTLEGADTHERLQVRLEYRGSWSLQRDLNEWLQPPRSLIVTLALLDTRQGSRPLAVREVRVRDFPRIRSGADRTSGEAWFAKLMVNVEDAAHSVLEPLSCRTPWFDVAVDRGKIRLSTLGFAGLAEGRTVLLVPTVDAPAASRWPIARIRSASRSDLVELEVLRGSSEHCTAGCKALTL